jgi:hypothetical protein
MKNKMLWIVLAGMVISSTAFTQEQPMAQKNLMQFNGKWKSSDFNLTMGDKNYGGEYSFDCAMVNMNTGIIAHEKFVNKEMGTMMAENLVGFDPNLKQIHIYTIDNMGTAHDHYGYWIDEHHLFVEYQGVVEGKMYVEQIDIVFQTADKWVLKLTAMLNGEIVEQAKGSFVK